MRNLECLSGGSFNNVAAGLFDDHKSDHWDIPSAANLTEDVWELPHNKTKIRTIFIFCKKRCYTELIGCL